MTAELCIGTARLPVKIVALTDEGGVIQSPHEPRVQDVGGLYVPTVGTLPVLAARPLEDSMVLVAFDTLNSKLKAKLKKKIAESDLALAAPALAFLVGN